MSPIFKHTRLMLLAVCCVALGAGISAIASAGAATSSSAHSASAASAASDRGRELARFAHRAVHGDVVVATKSGFVTVVFDRGTVQSVSGRQLTIKEGTKTATYKTVTLTIPTDAKVRDNRQASSLSAVTPGQRVMVVQAPKRTFVIARTPRSS